MKKGGGACARPLLCSACISRVLFFGLLSFGTLALFRNVSLVSQYEVYPNHDPSMTVGRPVERFKKEWKEAPPDLPPFTIPLKHSRNIIADEATSGPESDLQEGYSDETMTTTPEPKRWLDAVITYVNGSDPQWRTEFSGALKYKNASVARNGATGNRYADHNDLRILLRSIAKYGQIFRWIFLVVSGPSQIPTWLDRNSSRLRVVYHSDIWNDTSNLPSFNSLAIEANLHHIKGLSDAFVYFNDDLTILKRLDERDFLQVTADNHKVESIKLRLGVRLPDRTIARTDPDAHWMRPSLTAVRLLRHPDVCRRDAYHRRLGPDILIAPAHAPFLLLRSVLYGAERNPLLREAFQRTWSSRFRSGNELNVMTLFNGYIECAINLKTTKIRDASDVIYISVDTSIFRANAARDKLNFLREADEILWKKSRKFLCINDASERGVATSYGRHISQAIYGWRDNLFPEKSPFEI